jgi:putative ABC transport system permease protein
MPVFIVGGREGRPGAARAITQALHAADPGLPRPQVLPLGKVVVDSLARERFGATLLSVLAGLALVLTAFGTYGVLAYAVRRRRREIGIRMALDAPGRDVMRMVVVQGVGPVSLGLLLGLAVSAGLSRVLSAYLFGVSSTDPSTFAAVAAVLLGVALLASWRLHAKRCDWIPSIR